jgi:excinuclease ABC subunit A
MAKTATSKGRSRKGGRSTTGEGIVIHGARVHNLRNVHVEIPRGKFIVVTGVSGSGKSSLTIDTLYAEGQRRYAESLSAYARQFLMRMDKPDVDHIHGLCPAIAIEQKVITRTPRSTVGSMTEIYDYLRLLYARIGRTVSPVSGREVRKDDVSDVVRYISSLAEGSRVYLLVPFRTGTGRIPSEELGILMQKGFSRIYDIHAKGLKRIEELQALEDWTPTRDTYVLVDRLVIRSFDEDDLHRIADSVGTAFYEGEGDLYLEVDEHQLLHFSQRFELDGIRFEEPVPNLFSFNNPYGACPVCEGFSQVLGIDPNLVIPDTRLSVYEGAVAPWKGEKLGQWRDQFIRGAKHTGFPIHRPISELTSEQYQLLWKGNAYVEGIDAFFREVEQNLYKVQYRVLLSRYRGRTTCHACEGHRLRPEALYVKVGGAHVGELCSMQVSDLNQWFGRLQLNEHEERVARRILLEIRQRLSTLLDVGLGYLTLNRLANSLSGGESQRIQLTRNLGSNLTDSLYILDEPSIGLHPRDTHRLIHVLKHLRDLDNTVVVVEHDEQMMREADHIIDMGPLASHQGGEVVAEGDYEAIISNQRSLTGRYLRGELIVSPPTEPRKWSKSIVVEGARQHSLQDIDVRIPLQVLCVICGVSGSGKTTLVKQVLYPALQKLKTGVAEKVGLHRKLSGDLDNFSHVEMVDQNPIGKSSRSNPVTYVKAWDEIRDLYARQPLSKLRGYQPKHFSFNVDGGRCDACKGEGEQVVEMQFLADVHLTCEACKGRRFREEVLEVRFMDRNIHDLLEMSVEDAILFFKDEPDIAKKLQPLSDVGLGYVKLGQSSDTLSGGEAQRVKLASFLGRGRAQEKILFIFDEPTTGLHFHDITKLLASMNALIQIGHSVIVIEHNIDVIKSADWVIELGPEAGDGGGRIVYEGLPSGLRGCVESPTGRFM